MYVITVGMCTAHTVIYSMRISEYITLRTIYVKCNCAGRTFPAYVNV